jgi:hypothetical protein
MELVSYNQSSNFNDYCHQSPVFSESTRYITSVLKTTEDMSGQSSNPLALLAAQQRAAREASAANPVSYVPASKKDEILAYTVQRIYTVCHPITPTSGNGQTNHWTLALDVGEGKSVGMDVQPNPQQPHTNGGDKAFVILSLLDHLITSDAERHDLVSVTYGRPVGWYVDK